MKNRKSAGSFGGKGYYIALILCAAAIGISGYLYYQNANGDEPQLQDPTLNVDVMNPSISIDPTGSNNATEGTSPSGTNPTEKRPMKTGLPDRQRRRDDHP